MTFFDIFALLGIVGGACLGGFFGGTLMGGLGAVLGALGGGLVGGVLGRLPFALALLGVKKDLDQMSSEALRQELQSGVWTMRHVWMGALAGRGEEVFSALPIVEGMLCSEELAVRHHAGVILDQHFPELLDACGGVRFAPVPPDDRDPHMTHGLERCQQLADGLAPIAEQLAALQGEIADLGAPASVRPLLHALAAEEGRRPRSEAIQLALRAAIRRSSLSSAEREWLREQLDALWQTRPERRPFLPALGLVLATPSALRMLEGWAESPDLTEQTQRQLQDAMAQLSQQLQAETGQLSLASAGPAEGALSHGD